MAHHPMNKKNTFEGGLLLQRAKCEKSIFGKKMWSNFSKRTFCPSDAEFFPDSKMVLLFEFFPKLANLRRIKVFTFENRWFPLFMSECPWNTWRGENWSKNCTNDLYWTYHKGLWWNWPKKCLKFQSVWWYKYRPPCQKGLVVCLIMVSLQVLLRVWIS